MNNRLTLQDIAGLLAERTGKEKSAVEIFLQTLFSTIADNVMEDKIVKVKGLGTFKIILVESRESIHINTNERFTIPSHYKFSFVPDKDLAEQVNKPFSFFDTTEVNDKLSNDDLDVSEEVIDDEALSSEEESSEDIIVESISSPKEENNVESEEVCITNTPEEEKQDNNETALDEDKPKEDTNSEVVSEENDLNALPQEKTASLEDKPEAPEKDVVIPEVEDIYKIEDKEDITQKEKKSNRFTNRYITVFIVLLCILTAINMWLYWSPSLLQKKVEVPILIHKVETVVVKESIIKDSVKPVDVVLDKKPIEEIENEKQLPVKFKIKPGSRLTMISREYYGNKVFWVYIYEHNKNIISDPNNIPIGTEIEIPSPALYDIDVNDSISLNKAKQKQTEILNEKRNRK